MPCVISNCRIGAWITLALLPWSCFGRLLLAYEQSLVSSDDLSKLNMAFFTMNGVIAIVFGIFVVIGEVI
ncbi:MAG: hypothetical protein Ct9H300mP19_06580 [Dehalococcoidia bacterium]|nr:MAG: hypothetical protein Ct9H300mP19_06580 [Dehalococcoidia bacterium]